MGRGRVIRGCATWFAAFGAIAIVAPVRLVERADEGWMLWVMARVAHGGVLYRDVYDVTTPLPAWFGAAVVRVTGAELLVLRLLVAAVVATQVLTACSIVRRAGMQQRGRAVLAVTLVACASPMLVFTSFYTACAVLGALVALRAIVWLLDRTESTADTTVPLVSIGVAVAASFWSKPNIGLLALAAALVTLLVAGGRVWRTSARAVAIVVGGFAGVSVVVAVVLAMTRAWSAFIDQVFRSKGEYLDVGFSFATAVERRAEALVAGDPIDTRAIVWLLILATPVLVAATLGWAGWRARRHVDARVVGFVGFGVVGILGTVPRPGVDHLGSTMPLMVTAAIGAVLSLPGHPPAPRTRRGLLVVGSVLAGIAAVVVVGAALDAPMDDVTRDSEHFVGTPLPRDVVARATRLGTALEARTDGEVFFVRQDAGFLHFLTGTRNPLPYDIAERSDFGADGEAGVIRRLEAGDARWVCLRSARLAVDGHDPLVPKAIERWVRANAELAAELPMCDLYQLAARR